MSDTTNPFADAVNAAVGQRTAADLAASHNAMDVQMQAFEARVAAGEYNDAPHLIEKTRTQLQAIRNRAGLPAAPAPRTMEQTVAEQRAASFPMDDALHANMQAMIDADRADLETSLDNRVDAHKRLVDELGAKVYVKLLQDASSYKVLSDAEKVHLPSLKAYAAQGVRNTFKRTGKI